MARRSTRRSHSSPSFSSSLAHRAVRWVLGLVVGFFVLSILWVLLYRFVPPPITITMLGDMASGRSVTKRWMPLSRMDANMARAAIAAEDGNFCRHHGFDFKAIQKAMAGNEAGRRFRGGSTISQQTAKKAFL